jgi:molybdate/tungstate transport system substrate-binding protein
MPVAWRGPGAVVALLVLAACGSRDARTVVDTPTQTAAAAPAPPGGGPLVVFNAGSLARPLRSALDTFVARSNGAVRYEQEQAGSLETARKLTELGRVPDVIALADEDVFPQLLMPQHVQWYIRFARNRMVLAHSNRSRFAGEITTENWWNVVQRPGVEVGRSDPNLDPAGYRTLMVFQLAERLYAKSGLARELEAAAPKRNVRPKSADLVALAQTGELDYVWEYESVARASDLAFVRLPAELDLGTPAESALYAQARVSVLGRTPRDTIIVRGAPIAYALSIPRQAPHPVLAEQFVRFLLSADGRRIVRAEFLDALDQSRAVGDSVPASLAEGAR